MTENNRQIWIDKLAAILQSEKSNKRRVSYNEVLMAFPVLQQNSLDKYIINTKAVQDWAKPLGWLVDRLPKNETPKELEETPPILFTRIM